MTVTFEQASGTLTNRLLWEILEELRRPQREQALRRALYKIADLAEPESEIESVAVAVLGRES